MWWTWLAIALVLGLIISPILNIMPSKAQRTSARLRSRAAQLGLRVRLGELAGAGLNGKNESQVIYSRHWSGADGKLLSKLPAWQLVKGKLDHAIHFHGRWDWSNRQMIPDKGWQNALKTLFEQAAGDPLYERLTALEWNAQGVQVYWTEGTELADVDRLAELLAALQNFGLNRNALPSWPLSKTEVDRAVH
jgi:hypothetical protein